MVYEREPVVTKVVRQRESGYFQCVLRDQDGAVVPATALTSLTLVLYNITPGRFDRRIVNSRSVVDMLGAGKAGQNGVTFPVIAIAGVDTEHMRWDWTADDQQMLDLALDVERHLATFVRTWGPTELGRGDSFDVLFEVGRVHKT